MNYLAIAKPFAYRSTKKTKCLIFATLIAWLYSIALTAGSSTFHFPKGEPCMPLATIPREGVSGFALSIMISFVCILVFNIKSILIIRNQQRVMLKVGVMISKRQSQPKIDLTNARETTISNIVENVNIPISRILQPRGASSSDDKIMNLRPNTSQPRCTSSTSTSQSPCKSTISTKQPLNHYSVEPNTTHLSTVPQLFMNIIHRIKLKPETSHDSSCLRLPSECPSSAPWPFKTTELHKLQPRPAIITKVDDTNSYLMTIEDSFDDKDCNFITTREPKDITAPLVRAMPQRTKLLKDLRGNNSVGSKDSCLSSTDNQAEKCDKVIQYLNPNPDKFHKGSSLRLEHNPYSNDLKILSTIQENNISSAKSFKDNIKENTADRCTQNQMNTDIGLSTNFSSQKTQPIAERTFKRIPQKSGLVHVVSSDDGGGLVRVDGSDDDAGSDDNGEDDEGDVSGECIGGDNGATYNTNGKTHRHEHQDENVDAISVNGGGGDGGDGDAIDVCVVDDDGGGSCNKRDSYQNEDLLIVEIPVDGVGDINKYRLDNHAKRLFHQTQDVRVGSELTTLTRKDGLEQNPKNSFETNDPDTNGISTHTLKSAIEKGNSIRRPKTFSKVEVTLIILTTWNCVVSLPFFLYMIWLAAFVKKRAEFAAHSLGIASSSLALINVMTTPFFYALILIKWRWLWLKLKMACQM